MPIRLDREVVTTTSGFAALAAEWDELHAATPDASAYESWAFLFSWWQTHGDRYRLRLVTLREPGTGLLVGVLPLMAHRRRRLETLLLLVDNEPIDLLARPGWEPAVVTGAVRALRALPRWTLADLRPIRPGARMWQVHERWRGPREHAVVVREPHVAAVAEDEVLAALSRNHRSTLRRALRRAADDGLECRPAPVAEAARAGARLVELHRELWTDRDLDASHGTEAFARFVTALAERVTARGLGEVLEWTREGRVEVSALLLRGPRSLYVHHVGASRHAVERLQWSSLLVWEGLARARALGRAELGLGYGNEGYKARWASHEVPYERIRLGRGLLGHAFFGARRARHAVRRLRRRSGSGAQ